MRSDFAALILTHRRAGNVITHRTLRRCGYTGLIYLIVDDEDPDLNAYQREYGSDSVLVFSKTEIAEQFDLGDNFTDRKGSPIYARNACWELARTAGLRYFVELDDDYTTLRYRMQRDPSEPIRSWSITNLDTVLEALIRFLETTPTDCIAFSQGGDWIGGIGGGTMGPIRLKRKAMNSFVCDVDRPFTFLGRFNDDVNTYVRHGHTGTLFFTTSQLQLEQLPTQMNPGGLTDEYLELGTYVKSFYTVMFSPSSVTIRSMGPVDRRLHHFINWNQTVPKIMAETHRR